MQGFWSRAKCTLRSVMEIKDWFNFSIALAALLLSFWNLYVTNRQVDDIRVGIGLGHFFKYDKAQDKFLISSENTLTFINSGSRPAAITNVLIELVQPVLGKPLPTECKGENGESTGLHYEHAPFVIREGEILVQKLSLGPEEWRWLSVADGNRLRGGKRFTCLSELHNDAGQRHYIRKHSGGQGLRAPQ